MEFSGFTGEVQHRLELGTQGEAVRATRAILSTVGERFQAGEATDLASPLPMEIDYYLESVDHGQRFDYDEFVDRVAERAGVEGADAAFYGQAVVALLAECVPDGEFDDLEASLRDDYADRFELVGVESPPWPEP
jgi:uncharacterized protein (DUF2267 family)